MFQRQKPLKGDDNWGEAEILQFKQRKRGANAPCHPPLKSTATQFQLAAIQCLLQKPPKRQEKCPAHQSALPNARMHPEPEPVRGFKHSPSTRGTTDTRAERNNLGDGGSLTRQHLLRPGTRPGANQREQRQIRRENGVPAARRRRRGAPRRSGDGARARCRGGERGAGSRQTPRVRRRRPDDAAAASGGEGTEEGGERAGGISRPPPCCGAEQCTGNWTWVSERAGGRG